MGAIERTYGNIFRFALILVNPLKKKVIKTQCEVHKFINIQALSILKNDGYIDAFYLFSDYIVELNEGVVWADQDFKSIGHFYNPGKSRGLYGHHNALSLAKDYYAQAKKSWKENDIGRAMFYLGAAVHLVQDVTIPQHANIRLLKDHRQYESFVKSCYKDRGEFRAEDDGVYLNSIEEYIEYNAKIAIKVYKKFYCVPDEEKRFFRITKFALPLAEKTTAGCFLLFYRDVSRKCRVTCDSMSTT